MPLHQVLLKSIEAAVAFKVYHHNTVPWTVLRGNCFPRPQPKVSTSMTHPLPYRASSTRLARLTLSPAIPMRMSKTGWTTSNGWQPQTTGTIRISRKTSTSPILVRPERDTENHEASFTSWPEFDWLLREAFSDPEWKERAEPTLSARFEMVTNMATLSCRHVCSRDVATIPTS